MREQLIPICLSGLITALCSLLDTITWSSLVSVPLISQFNASVMFLVNAMHSGCG